MKVTEMTNLWVGYNETEDFQVLICALDMEEAQEIASEYLLDSNMEGKFEIREFSRFDTRFDCEYVLMKGQ